MLLSWHALLWDFCSTTEQPNLQMIKTTQCVACKCTYKFAHVWFYYINRVYWIYMNYLTLTESHNRIAVAQPQPKHDTLDHGPLDRYVQLRVAHEPAILGTFSPPPLVSDPDMHQGTCVTSGFVWSRWRGKLSRHSRRMRNPPFYVFAKRPIAHNSWDIVFTQKLKGWLLKANIQVK